MAILCRHHSEGPVRRETRMTLRKRKQPHQLRRNSASAFDPAHDCIKVLMLHVSKGLEFLVMAMVGAGRTLCPGCTDSLRLR